MTSCLLCMALGAALLAVTLIGLAWLVLRGLDEAFLVVDTDAPVLPTEAPRGRPWE